MDTNRTAELRARIARLRRELQEAQDELRALVPAPDRRDSLAAAIRQRKQRRQPAFVAGW